MVRQWLIGLCGLLMVWQAYGESSLSRSELVLGESVRWQITGPQAQSIWQSEQVALKPFFVVDELEVSDKQVQATLYPMMAGSFMVDKMSLVVKPNPNVAVQWQNPASQAWLSQWQVWQAEVILNDAGMQAQLTWPEVSESSVWQVLANSQPIWQSQGAKQRRFALAQSAKQFGSWQTVQPYVQVRGRRGRPWRFYAPNLTVDWQALPSFVPADLLVAEVALEREDLPLWVWQGDLQQTTWQLTAQDTQADTLPLFLTTYLTQVPELETLLPQITRQTAWQANGNLQAKLTWQQPWQASEWGRLVWPELYVTTMHPQTGRLQTLHLPEHHTWVGPSRLKIVFELIGVLLILVLSSALGLVIWAAWQKWQFDRHLQQRVHNPNELWLWLQQESERLLGQSVMSVTAWQQLWQGVLTEPVDDFVRGLNHQLYASNAPLLAFPVQPVRLHLGRLLMFRIRQIGQKSVLSRGVFSKQSKENKSSRTQ